MNICIETRFNVCRFISSVHCICFILIYHFFIIVFFFICFILIRSNCYSEMFISKSMYRNQLKFQWKMETWKSINKTIIPRNLYFECNTSLNGHWHAYALFCRNWICIELNWIEYEIWAEHWTLMLFGYFLFKCIGSK